MLIFIYLLLIIIGAIIIIYCLIDGNIDEGATSVGIVCLVIMGLGALGWLFFG